MNAAGYWDDMIEENRKRKAGKSFKLADPYATTADLETLLAMCRPAQKEERKLRFSWVWFDQTPDRHRHLPNNWTGIEFPETSHADTRRDSSNESIKLQYGDPGQAPRLPFASPTSLRLLPI